MKLRLLIAVGCDPSNVNQIVGFPQPYLDLLSFAEPVDFVGTLDVQGSIELDSVIVIGGIEFEVVELSRGYGEWDLRASTALLRATNGLDWSRLAHCLLENGFDFAIEARDLERHIRRAVIDSTASGLSEVRVDDM